MKYPAYPKYKPSGVEWLGEVPEHWEVISLRRSVQSIRNGTSATQIDENDNTIMVTRIETISSGEIDFEKVGFVEKTPALEEFCLKPGDILLSHINSLSMIGNCAIYEGIPVLYSGMNLLRIVPRDEVVPRWLWRVLSSDFFRKNLSARAKPAINQASITTNQLKQMQFPVPPLPEQRAIADFLDRETARLDTLVAKKRALIEKLKEKRTALISRTVTRGLPPEAAHAAGLDPQPKLKPSGIEWLGEVPEHWEVKKVRHLALLKSGENITSEELEDEGEFPVFGGNGIRGYSSRFSHQGHYVLIGRQGALCGNINYARGKFWASEHAVVVSPLTKLATVWLGEVLRSMNLNQYSISAAQPGLSVEMINKLKIPVPPLAEQRAIADYLDRETAKIDQMAAKVEAAIGRLQEYRTALITAAVTGKIDTRETE